MKERTNSKAKQANDIFLTENDAVISDKKEIADLFNNYFVLFSDSAAQVSVAEHGQDHVYANHPSILAIHGHDSHCCFKFQPIN